MPEIVSPLRYPGGKSFFYDYVKKLILHNNLIGKTYLEPFAGGAGIALKLLLNNDVEKIIINDFDISIYAFWYSILNYSDAMCDKICHTKINIKEWNKQKEIYNNQNANNLFDLGFATFFLNRTNVSGIISAGIIGGKKQLGKYKIDSRFNKDKLIDKIQNIAKEKNRIILYNLDAIDLLKNRNIRRYKNIFINFDPPYFLKGKELYKNFYKDKDHINLNNVIDSINYKWIVTYDVSDFIFSLYNKYRKSYLNLFYNINKKIKSKEYIFFSNNLDLPSDIELI